MFYVCVLCESCGSSQCFILHDLQFVNAGQECNWLPFARDILQSRSYGCLIGSHDVSFCLPHYVDVSAFIICSGVCACTEMLWMCVLYVSFVSKARPRTFGCVAIGSPVLFISWSSSYILQGLEWTDCKLFCLDLMWDCFVLSRQKLYVSMVVCISWLHSCLCVDVMVMSSVYATTWTRVLCGGMSAV